MNSNKEDLRKYNGRPKKYDLDKPFLISFEKEVQARLHKECEDFNIARTDLVRQIVSDYFYQIDQSNK